MASLNMVDQMTDNLFGSPIFFQVLTLLLTAALRVP
jgi:hypothetical protein